MDAGVPELCSVVETRDINCLFAEVLSESRQDGIIESEGCSRAEAEEAP